MALGGIILFGLTGGTRAAAVIHGDSSRIEGFEFVQRRKGDDLAST